jgi:hypothetical protein
MITVTIDEWDELCVVSGISAGGSPYQLLPTSVIDDVTAVMTSEIRRMPLFDDQSETASTMTSTTFDLRSVINVALTVAAATSHEEEFFSIPPWFSDHIARWRGAHRCIAIGHFNDREESPISDDRQSASSRLIPIGDDVEVRIVPSESGAGGSFSEVVVPDTSEKDRERTGSDNSDCSVGDQGGIGNVFVLEGCWIYLQAWLDHSTSSAAARISPHSGKPLSLASEFYEIVNSREKPRRCVCYLFHFLSSTCSYDHRSSTV